MTPTPNESAQRLRAALPEPSPWEALYRRAINEANGLTNFVEDCASLRKAERNLTAIEADAQALRDSPLAHDFPPRGGLTECDMGDSYE